MTAIAIFQTIGLTLIFPFVATKGRGLYTRIQSWRLHKKRLANGQSIGNNAEQQPASTTSGNGEDTMENPNSELSTAHFDVYLLRWCYLVFVVFFIVVGFIKTNTQLIGCTFNLFL